MTKQDGTKRSGNGREGVDRKRRMSREWKDRTRKGLDGAGNGVRYWAHKISENFCNISEVGFRGYSSATHPSI